MFHCINLMKRLLLAGNILSFSVGKKISTQEIAACLKQMLHIHVDITDSYLQL